MELLKKTETQCQQSSKRNFFAWNDQSIKWYLDSEYTTKLYKNISDELIPYMNGCDTILDIGCGVGGFSIEFAKRGYEVTAIDKSKLAIEALSKRVESQNLKNITPLNISFEDYNFNDKFDVIFISYTMGLVNENNLKELLNHINKYLILITPLNSIKDDFSITELYKELNLDTKCLKQSTYLDLVDILRKKNINYKLKEVINEYGQPFSTVDESVQFIYNYFDIPYEYHSQVSQWVKGKLIKLDNFYYLPSVRESILIIIGVGHDK